MYFHIDCVTEKFERTCIWFADYQYVYRRFDALGDRLTFNVSLDVFWLFLYLFFVSYSFHFVD